MPGTIRFDLRGDGSSLTNLDYTNEAVPGVQMSSAADDSTGPFLARFREEDGDVSVLTAFFRGDNIVFDTPVTLEWTPDGQAILIHRAPWDAIPELVVDRFGGTALDLRGWQRIDLDLTRPADQIAVIDGAQSGTVRTGSGDDVVVAGFEGRDLADPLTLEVHTGAGSDVVFFARAVENAVGGGDWRLRDARSVSDLGRGDDFAVGGASSDTMLGGDGDDSLEGFGGSDRLVGGHGQDTLAGGVAADVFAYASASEGGDLIVGFKPGQDRIEVSAAGFGGGLAAGADLAAHGRFVASRDGVATAPAGTGQFILDTDARTLLWDADGIGMGAAVLVAEVGTRALTAADLVVVA